MKTILVHKAAVHLVSAPALGLVVAESTMALSIGRDVVGLLRSETRGSLAPPASAARPAASGRSTSVAAQIMRLQGSARP